jgi:hypothetical protein
VPWITPEVVVKGFKKFCISDVMDGRLRKKLRILAIR